MVNSMVDENASVEGQVAGGAKEVVAAKPQRKPSKATAAKAKKATPKSKPKQSRAKPARNNEISLKTFPNFNVTVPMEDDDLFEDKEGEKMYNKAEDEMGDNFTSLQKRQKKQMDDSFADNEVF
jgi:hypothetical protein